MKHILLVSLLVTACATQFEGSPRVPNGPRGCMAICKSWNMDLVGMLAMGEYSDGCICQVRGGPPGAAIRGASAAGPGLVGVVMQMRRQQAAASSGSR